MTKLNFHQKIGVIAWVAVSAVLLIAHNPIAGYFGCFDVQLAGSFDYSVPVNLMALEPWYRCESEGALFDSIRTLGAWAFFQAAITAVWCVWLLLFASSNEN
jgi:hypothetical protein